MTYGGSSHTVVSPCTCIRHWQQARLGLLLRNSSLSSLHQLRSSFSPGCCTATEGREGYSDLSSDKDTNIFSLPVILG